MNYIKTIIFSVLILSVIACGQKPPAMKTANQMEGHSTVIVGKNDDIPERLRPLESEKKAKLSEREALINKNKSMAFDSDITLNDKERKVDNILHILRDEALLRYYARRFFPPANSFFKAKADIESSLILNILQEMPKGALLHLHSYGAGNMHWVVNYAEKHPNCYVYWYEDNGEYIKGQLGFYKPGEEPPGFNLVADIAESEPYFKMKLNGLLTLNENDYESLNIRDEFSKCLRRIANFLSYKPAFEDYYEAAFRTIINDNIQHVELRASLTPLYDLEGNTYTVKDALKIIDGIRFGLKKDHAEFDLKLIMTYSRFMGINEVWEKINDTMELKKEYPDLIIGFDLMGNEFSGTPTLFHLENWLALKKLEDEYGFKLPLYLHDGESNWAFNMNMYDAYLFGSKRIGQGLNLYKSPALEEEIKKNGIAIEVSPISNQIFRLVNDLRTHPANGYLSRGVQCVIGSDYMGVFGYNSLSFDFWEAFMAWDLDLKALKKLSINSIEYSSLSDEEKKKAMSIWQEKWDRFIDFTLKNGNGRRAGH